jgi:hypothetical protein
MVLAFDSVIILSLARTMPIPHPPLPLTMYPIVDTTIYRHRLNV